jgi:hypothetical protein
MTTTNGGADAARCEFGRGALGVAVFGQAWLVSAAGVAGEGAGLVQRHV